MLWWADYVGKHALWTHTPPKRRTVFRKMASWQHHRRSAHLLSPQPLPPLKFLYKVYHNNRFNPSLILIFVIPTAAIIVVPTAAINRVHAQGKKKSKKGKGKKGKGDEPAGKTQEQIQLEANQVRSQILEWHTDVAGSVGYAVHCLYDTSRFLLPVYVCYTHPILLYAGDGGL